MIKTGSAMGSFKAVARWEREIFKIHYKNEDIAGFRLCATQAQTI
jgi:hypothetical protein